MAVAMYRLINKEGFIPVDKWDTDEYPISEEDRIFKNIRGEIILPIHELFGDVRIILMKQGNTYVVILTTLKSIMITIKNYLWSYMR